MAFIIDGRVEHARRWIRHFAADDLKVLALSTYPCKGIPGIDLVELPHFLPTPQGIRHLYAGSERIANAIACIRMNPTLQSLWQQARITEIIWQAAAARKALGQFRPNLIHAMRIQNEGYVAALSARCPWVLSTWGADFILHAHQYLIHRLLTSWLIRLPAGLTADCERDIRIALEKGYPKGRPIHTFPGNGGVDLRVFRPGSDAKDRAPIVLFPRGLTPNIQPEYLMKAIRLTQSRLSQLKPIYMILVKQDLIGFTRRLFNGIGLGEEFVHILPFLDQAGLSEMLQRSAVIVSPSLIDGTPNIMLEAMACGCFPIMSNLDSISEWIHHGENGFLFQPKDPEQMAASICNALENPALRSNAAMINAQIIRERADCGDIMPRVRKFYEEVLQRNGDPEPGPSVDLSRACTPL